MVICNLLIRINSHKILLLFRVKLCNGLHRVAKVLVESLDGDLSVKPWIINQLNGAAFYSIDTELDKQSMQHNALWADRFVAPKSIFL